MCGAYVVAYLLRAYGFTEYEGLPVDEDLVGWYSGTALTAGQLAGDPNTVPQRAGRVVGMRLDYKYPVRTADSPATSGTAPEALGHAVATITGGRLTAIPVRGADGALTGEESSRLLGVYFSSAGAWDAQLVANVQTGLLKEALVETYDLLGSLLGLADYGPMRSWDVGHYFHVAGRTPGPPESYLIRDSYKALGLGGYHVQPADSLARAVHREDGVEGGYLILAPAARAGEIRQSLDSAGLEVGYWDNGTPVPEVYETNPPEREKER